MTGRTAWLMVIVATVGSMATGCRSRRPSLYRVSGSVVFAGRPVAGGEVSFAPDRGNAGPGAFAEIVNGRYQASLGIAGGPMIVTVTGYDGPGAGEGGPGAARRLLFEGWQITADLPRSDATLDIEVPAGGVSRE